MTRARRTTAYISTPGTAGAPAASLVARPASPLELGLRLRLMLTLAAVAIFPIAFVSYVVVRDEVRNVNRSIDFETRDAAQSAQARFTRLLDRRQLHAVAVAASPRLQAAIRRHDTASLARLARRNRLLIEVHGRSYGRRLENAFRARAQLVSGGHEIGSVVAQLPADKATLRQLSAGAARGVQPPYNGLGAPPPAGRGPTPPPPPQN